MVRKTNGIVFILGATSLLFGCEDPRSSLWDGRNSQNSQTLVVSSSGEIAYVADAERDLVSIVDRLRGTSHAITMPLGSRPTRLARLGDRIYASLRGLRAVAVLREDPALGLVDDGVIPVGAEPYGLVAFEDPPRLFVACALDHAVFEIEVDSRQVVRRIPVADEPRWLALHPGQRKLFVASALQGRLSTIDLPSGVVEPIWLPSTSTYVFTSTSSFEIVPSSTRVTGDPAVALDGRELYVPAVFVSHRVPTLETRSAWGEHWMDGYRRRVSGALLAIALDAEGTPLPARVGSQGVGLTRGLTASTAQPVSPALTVMSTWYGPSAGHPVSVAPTADGRGVVVAIENANALVMLNTREAPRRRLEPSATSNGGVVAIPGRRPWLPLTIATDGAPRGLLFTKDERLIVHAFADRTVFEIEGEHLVRVLDAEEKTDWETNDQGLTESLFVARDLVRTPLGSLSPEAERGLRLFHSADDGIVSEPGAGISCSSCHFEGRTDGLTWKLSASAWRQTPSLAGFSRDMEPVTWEGDVSSVAEHAMGTSIKLMGGTLTKEQAQDLAAFVFSIPPADTSHRGESSDAVERGRAIFSREDVGCAGCHSGPTYSDGRIYSMVGLERVKTRSLLGVAATPPYLHDGSIDSLEALVDSATRGGMGDTSMLSAAERADLVAFLRSL